jgi:nitroreductase
MMLKELILRTRSYRRFHQEYAISVDTLKELVDLARFSASGSNKQPLKFLLSYDAEKNAKIFPTIVSWKGMIPEWPGPKEGERPSAYIIILGDKEIMSSFGYDPGIAAQSIMLGATEKGLGGCMIGSMRKKDARNALNIPSQYDLLLAIALGKPKEKVVIETLSPGQNTNYWLDKDDSHHVPKRRLEDIIIV